MKPIFRHDIDREFPPVEYQMEAGDELRITRTWGLGPQETESFTTTVREALANGDLRTSHGTTVHAWSVARPDVRITPGAAVAHEVRGRSAHHEWWDGEQVQRTEPWAWSVDGERVE